MDSTTRIENITLKVNRLAELLNQLRAENAALKTQLADREEQINFLQKELDTKQADWKALEEQKAGQSEQLKKQIDSYIEEIDRCIEWLQNE
ncbi:MAG: hypothetical protein IPH04_07245 [Saprospirales bacterium]|jgi:septal ring factor EnvC (AmiA/AmiB activator)|nr:hypothetical protein [Saprospirales bacterium]MBK6902599.1 hypothetical protein [Saprospirales bacterium]MBK7335620.1 hypothetical protein [Saprospirales bacterium]